MGINMEKMRARMEALQGNGNNKKNSFWKPQEGEQTIRLVAPADGDPFRDYWFHYDVAGEPGFLSPKRNFGEDCPLDDYVRALWREGSDYSKPAGASFPETKITPRRRSSLLHEDETQARAIMESVPDFDEVFSDARRSTTQVADILDRFLNTVDETVSNQTATTTAGSVSDVDKAFSELLGS